jgi:putative transposase
MPQSLAKVYIHLVFSTKERFPWLDKAVAKELYAYLSTVLRNMDCLPICIGGIADHIHLLFVLSRTRSMAQVVEAIKKPSSKWLKTKGPGLVDFHWQNGYGAFSVSESIIPRLKAYIDNQDHHHHKVSFQDEFLRLLDRHGIEYDERFVWD